MKTPNTLKRTFAIATLSLSAACGTVASDDVSVKASDGPADLVASETSFDVADFTLTDTTGATHTLSDYVGSGKTVVLEWFNPDCPFVQRYHTGDAPMVAMYDAVNSDDLVWLAINSNSEGSQGSGLERNQQAVADWDLPYPVLLDMDGKIGRAYSAATTPHMFIISPEGTLLYEGAIDDSNGRGETKTNYVAKTLREYRAGEPVTITKTKSFGCSVKYGM